jgi:hypothetical protein
VTTTEQAAVAAETGPASAGRDAKQRRSYAAAATAIAGVAGAAPGSADGSGPRRVMQQSQPSGRKDKALIVHHSATGGHASLVSVPWGCCCRCVRAPLLSVPAC